MVNDRHGAVSVNNVCQPHRGSTVGQPPRQHMSRSPGVPFQQHSLGQRIHHPGDPADRPLSLISPLVAPWQLSTQIETTRPPFAPAGTFYHLASFAFTSP